MYVMSRKGIILRDLHCWVDFVHGEGEILYQTLYCFVVINILNRYLIFIYYRSDTILNEHAVSLTLITDVIQYFHENFT